MEENKGLTGFRMRLALAPIAVICLVVFLCLRSRPEVPGLHADRAIRKLANFSIAEKTHEANSIIDIPCLNVVPNGETLNRGEVFLKLGLDPKLVTDFRQCPSGRVTFLTWRLSASYDISCMSAEDEDEHSFEDLNRLVYGIRLIHRDSARENGLFFWTQ